MNVSQVAPLSELLGSAAVVSIGLRTRFRGLLEREALLFKGPQGWAEWSPFTEYSDEEAAVWLRAAIEFAYQPTPALQRSQIGINATLPAVSPEQVEKVLGRFGRFSTVKIKVAEPGEDISADLARINRVVELFPDVKIRLDANGGYTVLEALNLSKTLLEYKVPLEYLEQPVASIGELAQLRVELKRNALEVQIAADESIRKATDPMAVVHAGAADILVLKAAPLGGIRQALEIAAEAALPAVVSSALETSVGLSMGAHLAAALPELTFDCGLGTASLLIGDVSSSPLKVIDGQLEVRRVEVDQSRLDTFRAEDHRADWWLERLERCYKLL